ncbi:MAG: redox-regulated ATPase YchF [Candidatus Bathyarchaeota archaeon]|nr:MAG: redox-regulated ATPase YchF [Candidatus Bathyarchaeota archaeon]
MSRLVGLVGKANVGKSTFFAAATMKAVEIAGFPFTTIEANKGVAYLRSPCVCKELGVEDDPVNSACVDGIRLVPVDLIDCPGLIRGAHLGRGLGNQFLDEVRRADALIIVADAAGATDDNGQQVPPGSHDPIEDVRMLESEFDLWLLGIIRKDWERIARTAMSAREEIGRHLEAKLTGLGMNKFHIAAAVERAALDPYKTTDWDKMDLSRFVTELRRASKPLIVAANKADKEPAEENIKHLREAGYEVVPTCAEAELSLRRAANAGLISYTPGDSDFQIVDPESLTPGQKRALEMIREKVLAKWGSTGIQEVINAAFFSLLDTIPVYPVEDAEKLTDHQGRVLPDCYLVPRGTTTKQFASLIHTELGESFIFAIDARTKRRLSDDHVLKEDDIIQIVAAKARR